jgi:hypothetical protein
MISAAAVAAAAMTLMTWTSSALHRARPRRSDRIPHLASCGRRELLLLLHAWLYRRALGMPCCVGYDGYFSCGRDGSMMASHCYASVGGGNAGCPRCPPSVHG